MQSYYEPDDDWYSPDNDYVHIDDVPDIDGMKDMLGHILIALYSPRPLNVYALELDLEELAGMLHVRIPSLPINITRKQNIKTNGEQKT